MREFYLNARDFGVCGSEFKTTARAVKGSNVFELAETGDFKVGDEVFLTGCNVHLESACLFERKDMNPRTARRWVHNQPLLDRVEMTGYDGSQGEWKVYFIDLYPEAPDTFRWTENYGREWHEDVPLSEDWIGLNETIRIKVHDFPQREWGCTAVFVWSSRMTAVIEKIEGNRVTLSASANRDCVTEIMHSDTMALQRAIDTALLEKKNLYLPNGRYRLTGMLTVKNPSGFTLEGEDGQNTILDNSIGALGVERQTGSCLYVTGGESVTLKNLFMVGNLGFADRDMSQNLFCRGGTSVFGFYFNKTNATCFESTKRILVENCHARKMSAECFYSQGAMKETAEPADRYSRSITYLRCSVEDCARNAFNNNDKSEHTSILFCRVKDIGNAAWEGASRFTVINGCYVSNAGCIAMGNTRRRLPLLYKRGSGQHMITDNYFEGGTVKEGMPMIKAGSIATQIIIKGNTFINFNSTAISVIGEGQSVDTPPENVIISGNSIDLTAVEGESKERCGIKITSNYVTVSDNHIFVRGETDEKVKGIVISDDATRIVLHDNTLAGLGVGIESQEVFGAVGDVVDEKTFYRLEGAVSFAAKPMLLRPMSHRYRGWVIRWLSDGTESVIEDFDPLKLTFTLSDPREMHTGDRFCIYGPKALPWSIHHNMIDNCAKAFSLETHTGKRAVLDGNIF